MNIEGYNLESLRKLVRSLQKENEDLKGILKNAGIDKYNNIYKIQMPKVTPHVCRHTYCSNMAKSGMNPKTLQYLMGHSDISVTLNVYTHVNFDDAKAELERMKVM